MKGQKARSQAPRATFEGGQTALFKRIRKFGQDQPGPLQTPLTSLNLKKVMAYIQQGRLDVRKQITMKDLVDAQIFNTSVKHGVVLVGQAKLDVALDIQVTFSSPEAKASVEKMGGNVDHIYFTKRALRAHLKPEAFDFEPRRPGYPRPKLAWRHPGLLDITYKHRGLLEEKIELDAASAKKAAKQKNRQTGKK
jgi:ribosomal protein L15